ncbi:photosynthetic complex assembly protein PuhC [Aquisediminimonas profunda]|uniref:photosynthetic complex assembly protein PuhC n=1 Tax=Aquisediminimonas profunda TaxID=1550733 RepID=UPI001C62A810|nr:photosynthetic complex assembly protein PuhC [Aquisediminimonas profunda]
MSGHTHSESLPKGALIGAAVLVGLTLAFTGAVALGIVPGPVSAEQRREAVHMPKLAVRDLQFLDQKDGSVMIRDVTRGTTASIIQAGSKTGFIRGVMRGLARDRHMRGLNQEPPFRLTLWANQNLALEDLATGRVIELNGFGDTNRQAFLDLLLPAPTTRVASR